MVQCRHQPVGAAGTPHRSSGRMPAAADARTRATVTQSVPVRGENRSEQVQ
ncbi:Hypothetical protein SLIV_33568 [Streptomyces lividans TK24]|uniref:Uncharacterized protein n=1 Tax=Streptomyces lividans TK24 TaxID=457428 RepID=A0ABX6TQN3_STRLI|nr:Hypothetical protein SLIV_33568 [Streptomyces lividans TK24]QSJ13208.1 Hypothetical protein SLIVDG2_33568 [Streptomyces lividans]QTD74118.1 Hypothetical protein SLIVYQS_33568 [Streptomyces lividans TK24] [Streptomyces lividans]